MENDNKSIPYSQYEELEKKVYDLKNLIGLGISLASNLNFHSLVESILYSCIGQIFVEKVAILLQTDIDESNFSIHMSKGFDINLKKDNIILKQGSKLLKYLNQKPETHEYRYFMNNVEFLNDLKKIDVLTPSLLVPMKSKQSINGIIILGDKITGEKFTKNEKEFLQDLAKFAAIAVENSRLYLMATLDRMTRLHVHQYFQERLSEEIRRAIRNTIPVTLIMSDIDHFKKFNDTYGHQQGDIVLKETAMIFRKHIRSIDIAARYGGEEFAIILPDTDLKQAITIANRLRSAIEQYAFSGQDKPLHVTSSFGVAQYNPQNDSSKDDFIKRTDRALYKAKESGRNKVVALK